jgi:hypothetical protein
MSNKKYILANIRLPMEVLDDGSLKNLSEYLTMDFERLDELPPLPENNGNYEAIKENLKSIISMSRKEDNEEDKEAKEMIQSSKVLSEIYGNKIKLNIKWFFENHEYDWEIIHLAATTYIESEKSKNFKYTRTSKYFIRKQDTDKSWSSDLAAFCELVKNGEEFEEAKYTDKVF